MSRPSRPVRNPKLVGERAECAFLFQALSRGLAVSQPFGDSCAYDAIVDNGKRLFRVQVRSTRMHYGTHRGFQVSASHGRNKQENYTEADIELLAVWIVPRNTWYLIPARILDCGSLVFWPHVEKSRGRWEKYKEAWHLLTAEG
ncbi:MAG TPA: group I intron-associated PD-(D/E)XK endonuclease [Terriglobales bacterium]|nr:group I intron-associated PD-(D/E)XK endonuclease [Terriglobales bacterium]